MFLNHTPTGILPVEQFIKERRKSFVYFLFKNICILYYILYIVYNNYNNNNNNNKSLKNYIISLKRKSNKGNILISS